MTPNGKVKHTCEFDECPAFIKEHPTDERTTCQFFTEGYGGAHCWVINKIYQMMGANNHEL